MIIADKEAIQLKKDMKEIHCHREIGINSEIYQ